MGIESIMWYRENIGSEPVPWSEENLYGMRAQSKKIYEILGKKANLCSLIKFGHFWALTEFNARSIIL